MLNGRRFYLFSVLVLKCMSAPRENAGSFSKPCFGFLVPEPSGDCSQGLMAVGTASINVSRVGANKESWIVYSSAAPMTQIWSAWWSTRPLSALIRARQAPRKKTRRARKTSSRSLQRWFFNQDSYCCGWLRQPTSISFNRWRMPRSFTGSSADRRLSARMSHCRQRLWRRRLDCNSQRQRNPKCDPCTPMSHKKTWVWSTSLSRASLGWMLYQ